jgi:hypothetical protein
MPAATRRGMHEHERANKMQRGVTAQVAIHLHGAYAFKSGRELADASAQILFSQTQSKHNDGVAAPRNFPDYTVSIVETTRYDFDHEVLN